MEIMQSICSGLIHSAKLEPCSEKENSFVGIYASTSSGKNCSFAFFFTFLTNSLLYTDSFLTEIGK